MQPLLTCLAAPSRSVKICRSSGVTSMVSLIDGMAAAAAATARRARRQQAAGVLRLATSGASRRCLREYNK
jgi:hypothetical protein